VEAIMKTWLTVTEGAEYAGVSRDTIYTACERAELRHARIGGRRAIRLKPEWIDGWLEQHTRDTMAARANDRGDSDHGTDRANA
jgi:excisionase family DNA binding protein